MRLDKFADCTQFKNNLEIILKIMKQQLETYLKNWENHGILSVQKSGNPDLKYYNLT